MLYEADIQIGRRACEIYLKFYFSSHFMWPDVNQPFPKGFSQVTSLEMYREMY